MRPGGGSTSPPAGSGRAGWVLLLLLGALACGGYLGAELYLLSGELGFPLDDSWIHLQFARNLAAGEGLSYNPGELAAGSTAPLWTALLSLLFLLPGDPVLSVKILGVALFLAGAHAVTVLGAELGLSRRMALLAGLLTVATRWLVWSALSGMEIPLFVVLSLWGMILHLRERRDLSRPALSPVLLAAAALARPEGLLLLALGLVDRLLVFERDPEGAPRWRPRPKRLAEGLGPALVILAPMLLFNALVGGSPLPTTFAAKATSASAPATGGAWEALRGVLGLLPDPHYLYAAPLGIFFGSQPYMLLLAAAGALVLIGALGTDRDRGLLPALWLVALPLAFGVLSAAAGNAIAGNFGRYYFPLFPVLVVLGTLGLKRAATAWLGEGSRRRALAALVAALLVWPTATSLVRGAGAYARHVANVQGSDVRLARWLGERLPPQAVLAVNDIGAFKYFLPNPIVDLAGILHPEVRRYVGEAIARTGDGHPGLLRFLDERRPDYLVVFPEWYPGLEREDSGFRPLYGLSIPDNLAMGGDRIVVYSTPWTRYALEMR